jgi:hypothetical protein
MKVRGFKIMITCSEQEFKFDLVIEEAGQHIE